MAASPFDSPEVAARFKAKPWNESSPSPRPRIPAVLSNNACGWNIGPLSALSNGRAVSAGHRPVSSSNGISQQLDVSKSSSQDYWNRYQQIKCIELAKNELIEELCTVNQKINQQLQRMESEYEHFLELKTDLDSSKQAHENEAREFKACLTRDAFVLCLIDGNNLTFKPEFLSRGASGGRETATLLHEGISNYVRNSISDLEDDFKVVIRVYGDVESLGNIYCQTSIISSASAFAEFACGFSDVDCLTDFVDIPCANKSSQEKIHEHVKLSLYDPRCRQIFFGTANNSTQLHELETDEHALNRVTLVGGPIEAGTPQCSLERICLRKVFGDSMLALQTSAGSTPIVFSSTGLPTPPPSMPAISRQLSEISIKDVKDFTPSIPMAKSASTTSTISSPRPSPRFPAAQPATSKASGGSWASLAAKPPPAVTITPGPVAPYKAADPASPTPPKNRKGQRIDPQMKHDKAEVDRVKKLKMCNVHYLRNECGYGDGCSHSHKHKPSKQDIDTLRLVARMAPCMHGSDCEDVKCIYGHVCPAPEGRKGEDCIFGGDCRFPPELHRIDLTVVRTIKV